MRAVVFEEHGGPDVLKVDEVEDPTPGPEEVVVDVAATALNQVDVFTRSGHPALDLPLPHVLGADVAGTVAGVGDRVEGWSVGDRVVVNPGLSCDTCRACRSGEHSLCDDFALLGEHRWGGYAEQVAVPAANLHAVPDDVDPTGVAACPVTVVTAWRMLMTRAGVRQDDTVLVLGATGGVGTMAIQVAGNAGARVLGATRSDEKAKRLQDLGAEPIVIPEDGGFHKEVYEATDGEGADVIVENVGEAVWKPALKCVRKGGRIVTCGATTGFDPGAGLNYVFWKQIEILGSTMGSRAEFADAIDQVLTGRIEPVVDRVFDLEDAADAHRHLTSGDLFGKVVLEV